MKYENTDPVFFESLRKGDSLTFSGEIRNEMSFTTSGALSQPVLYVLLSGLARPTEKELRPQPVLGAEQGKGQKAGATTATSPSGANRESAHWERRTWLCANPDMPVKWSATITENNVAYTQRTDVSGVGTVRESGTINKVKSYSSNLDSEDEYGRKRAGGRLAHVEFSTSGSEWTSRFRLTKVGNRVYWDVPAPDGDWMMSGECRPE